MVVVVAVIVLVVLTWALSAPPDDSVARRESTVGALRQAVERAALYEPPPDLPADEARHNVHVIRNLPRRGDGGMTPAA